MPPSDFANASLTEVLDQLTTDELIHLSGGVGFWRTAAIERLGIPSIKVSDGPNGIRGNQFYASTPAKCLPSATALASTWDTNLIREVGLKLLAPEAKLKAASVVLGPTCNIQRNPLGGRSFESFSEDPYLSGMMAAAYVSGVQKGGVGTAIKHFFGNDKENDRQGYDCIISDRAIREIYLMPFMLAQKYANPWSYMTAYNKVNGLHVCENPAFLQGILRNEWGFDGAVMSDWFGTYSVATGLNAGVDLEMPGINKWRTLDFVNRSIQARKVTARTLKKRAANVLGLVQRCAKGAPEILDGDGAERTTENEEDKLLMRRTAAQGIVLLKNTDKLLPIDLRSSDKKIKKIAIVGGNAKASILSGGGSAALKASYFVSPYDGIVNAVKDSGENVEVLYAEGARAYMTLPSLDYELFTANGERGWMGSWYAHESDESLVRLQKVYKEQYLDETRVFISADHPKGLTKRWSLILEGYLKPREADVDFEFGLTAAGRAKLYVDDKLVIDNWTRQRRGESFFGSGSQEETGIVPLKAGVKHKVVVEFCNVRGPADGDEDEALMDSNPGVRLGGAVVQSSDDLMEQALSVAASADVVIAVIGLNADWETEGNDRKTLSLPGRTDELIQRLTEVASGKVAVVTQAGSAILMPWISSISSLVHTWYLGNATGDAIADVLFGNVNPSGRLSLTFPVRAEDVPSYASFHSEHGEVRYGEDLFVGYKHYQYHKLNTLFPFGYGLSYTTFTYTDLQVATPSFHTSHTDDEASLRKNDISISVSVTVTNTGNIGGATVVQVYIGYPPSPSWAGLTHPTWALKGFEKVFLEPGSQKVVEVKMDKYAVSYWDKRVNRWAVDAGKYEVLAGGSSQESDDLKGSLKLEKGFEWVGI